MDQVPTIGRIVLFRSIPHNGVSEHPAIITRVWDNTCVNLTVFADAGPPQVQTSVLLNADLTAGEQNHAWRWPPRAPE